MLLFRKKRFVPFERLFTKNIQLYKNKYDSSSLSNILESDSSSSSSSSDDDEIQSKKLLDEDELDGNYPYYSPEEEKLLKNEWNKEFPKYVK